MAKVIELKLSFATYRCQLKLGRYQPVGNTAVSFSDVETGEPIATATIPTDEPFPDRYVLIKNYSEGEGMYQSLLDAGVVKPGQELHIGPFQSSAWLCELTDDAFEWAAVNAL